VPPQRQTNIRLDEPLLEWLEAVAFIHRRSVAEELRAAVDRWVEDHREDPRVRAARELRDPHRDEEQGEVRSLAAKRERASGKEG
jgi:ribosomal 50S subunit-recycling heat shock protein